MKAAGITLVSLIGMALCASAYVINDYKVSPEAPLHIPAAPDSTQKENPFGLEKLLKSRHFATQWPETAGWTTMAPDTAGNLVLVNSHQTPGLRTLTTLLRAERYAKGKLKLTSGSRAEVLVNGEAKVSKSGVDSVPADASGTVELLPMMDYSVIVNVLTTPEEKGDASVKLEFIPDEEYSDVVVTASPRLNRVVNPLSTMQGERVSGMSVSPDGKYLLTKYREIVSATETRRRAVLTETATGRVVTEGVNTSADWMPKGSRLYYTQSGVKDYDLYTVSVPDMRVSKIATAIPTQDIVVSPDESYLFYYDEVEGVKDDGPLHRIKAPDDRIPGDRNRFYICRYDLKNGVSTPLTYGGATTTICDMSRDGSKLLYMSQRQTPNRYPFYRVSLVQMDMNSFDTDTILNDVDGFINDAVYSPDSKKLFVLGGPDAFDGIGANYAPEPIGNSFDVQGFIMDLATRKVVPMTRDFNPNIEGHPEWNPVDNMIYFRGERGFYIDIYRLNPADGKISMLTDGKEIMTVRGFSVGNCESRYMAYWGGSFTDDGVAAMLDLKSGKSSIVADPLKNWLGNTEFGKMEPWTFTAKDGTVVDGYMCLPPGFDPAEKYPLIVYYYGGTSPTNASFYHLYSPQVFASRGYVVYTLNPSGTTGYGQEYSARHVNAWGKRTADEIIEGVKKFCAAHQFVNDKKIGCLGASYGGFMTQYLLTKTDIFAAAMSHAGISNVTSYWGEGFWGYSYNSVAAAKRYPWTDPELYTRQGSLFNADKIHTPLLLLHGTVDTNVPIGESIQLFNALRVLGREVEFITVEGENHVISGYDNKVLWQNTIMAWFAKWLQDDPRWWNSLYKD